MEKTSVERNTLAEIIFPQKRLSNHELFHSDAER
jgi:hypothetical protein